MISCALKTHAQQQDAGGSAAIQVQNKINQTFTISLFTQGALQQNFTEPGYWLADIGIRIYFTDNWYGGLNFRHSQIYQVNNTFAPRNYLYGECGYTKRIEAFSLNWRGRFISKSYGIPLFTETQYKEDKHYLRNRLLVRYDINYHHDVFGSVESTYRLDYTQETERLRYVLGYGYTFNQNHKIQCTYSISQEQNREAPDTDYNTGITYIYKF